MNEIKRDTSEITDALSIKIWYSEQGGYMYDIYNTEEPSDDDESIDGGLCTGNIADALSMATEQAGALITLHTYYVARAGEYLRVQATDEHDALEQARNDYKLPPSERAGDWKHSEHDADEWDVTKA